MDKVAKLSAHSELVWHILAQSDLRFIFILFTLYITRKATLSVLAVEML